MNERWKPTDYSDLHKPTVLDKASEAASFFAEQYEKLSALPEIERLKLEAELALFAGEVIDEVRVFQEVSAEHDSELAEFAVNPAFQGMVTHRVISEFLRGSTITSKLYPQADLIGLGQSFVRSFSTHGFPLPSAERLDSDGIVAFQDPDFQELLFEANISHQEFRTVVQNFRDEQTKIALGK